MVNKYDAYVSEKAGDVNVSAFQIEEAYKKIRTNLLFALANSQNRVVLISSAEPSAGKSTLTANLAIVMAQTGARVLLIDSDMRKPTQHRHFHVSKTLGLSKILGGMNTVEECLHRQVMPNLDLITAGSIPPNPSELIGSARMKELLEVLSKGYDYIFVDTPPIGVVTDALLLSPMAAGIVMAARQKQTTYEELAESIEAIRQIGSNLLGVVVTDVRTTDATYYRGSRKYYRQYNYEYRSRRNEG